MLEFFQEHHGELISFANLKRKFPITLRPIHFKGRYMSDKEISIVREHALVTVKYTNE